MKKTKKKRKTIIEVDAGGKFHLAKPLTTDDFNDFVRVCFTPAAFSIRRFYWVCRSPTTGASDCFSRVFLITTALADSYSLGVSQIPAVLIGSTLLRKYSTTQCPI